MVTDEELKLLREANERRFDDAAKLARQFLSFTGDVWEAYRDRVRVAEQLITFLQRYIESERIVAGR